MSTEPTGIQIFFDFDTNPVTPIEFDFTDMNPEDGT